MSVCFFGRKNLLSHIGLFRISEITFPWKNFGAGVPAVIFETWIMRTAFANVHWKMSRLSGRNCCSAPERRHIKSWQPSGWHSGTRGIYNYRRAESFVKKMICCIITFSRLDVVRIFFARLNKTNRLRWWWYEAQSAVTLMASPEDTLKVF